MVFVMSRIPKKKHRFAWAWAAWPNYLFTLTVSLVLVPDLLNLTELFGALFHFMLRVVSKVIKTTDQSLMLASMQFWT